MFEVWAMLREGSKRSAVHCVEPDGGLMDRTSRTQLKKQPSRPKKENPDTNAGVSLVIALLELEYQRNRHVKIVVDYFIAKSVEETS